MSIQADRPLIVTASKPFSLGDPIVIRGRTGTVLCIGNSAPRRQRLTVRVDDDTVGVQAEITGGPASAGTTTAVQPGDALRAAQGVLGGSPVAATDLRHLAAAYLELLAGRSAGQ